MPQEAQLHIEAMRERARHAGIRVDVNAWMDTRDGAAPGQYVPDMDIPTCDRCDAILGHDEAWATCAACRSERMV